MKTSEYMDKQIMGLSRSLSDEDFSDFGSSFSNLSCTLTNGGSMDHIDFVKVGRKKAGNSGDRALLISVIDQKMKEHADNLMYKVDGLSARLTQLESRTRQLENTIDDFKESVDFNHGRTDGKLRELEHILREVLGGIQDLRDKQEIAEAKMQLEKLEMSKRDQQAEKQNSNVQTNFAQGLLASEPLQFQQPLPHPVSYSPQHSLPPPPLPILPYRTPPSVLTATAPQLPTHVFHYQIPSIVQTELLYPPTSQTSDTTQQQSLMLSSQQLHSPHPALHQPYQPAPQFPQSSQFSHIPQLQPPNINQPYGPSSQYFEEISYETSKPPNVLRYSHPSDSSPQTQQFYGSPTKQTYDLSSNSEFPAVYSQGPGNSNFNDGYPYGGSTSRYNSSPSQFSQSASFPNQLPTAKVLPHPLPTASIVDKESGPDSAGNRVPNDDVVNKVVAMGFRRDLVRATVRKLTDNGQPVDFNAVLDMVMNNEGT